MPRGGIGARIARRLFLSANVLVRVALLGFIALFLSQFFVATARAADPVRAVRIWPSQDYTRITLESRQPIRHSLLVVKNPERLVLDLQDIEYASVQREIADKVLASDPYIANLRAGRYMPGVVRLVLDLKQEVKPQIFVLKPVGEYGHRLVLDLYPVEPIDPLMALLDKPEARPEAPPAPAPAEAKPEVAASLSPPQLTDAARSALYGKSRPEVMRLVTIALDAGHGGEDPGARGKGDSREKQVTLTIARKLK